MDIANILGSKYPGTKWVLNGDDYKGLDWLDESPKPTKEQLEALATEVEYENEYVAVEKKRQAAYRDESDPLFFYAERGKGQKQAWLDKVAEIDARYPYPEKPTGKK